MALVMLASVRFAAEYCGIKDDLEKVSPQLKKLFGERPFTNRDCHKLHIAAYDNKLREKALWDQQITADLAEAIATRQIRPYLQPITDRSGKVVGAEALARWIHPQHGFMSPAVFIPLLEKNGLIVVRFSPTEKRKVRNSSSRSTSLPRIFIISTLSAR